MVWGVWFPQLEASLQITVTDANSPSYMSHSVTDLWGAAEDEKRSTWLLLRFSAYQCPHQYCVVTIDGVLGYQWDILLFLCCLAKRLSSHSDKHYGDVFVWIKAWLSFVVIRATDLFLKGSHVSWRSCTGIDDEAERPAIKPITHMYVCMYPSQSSVSI